VILAVLFTEEFCVPNKRRNERKKRGGDGRKEGKENLFHQMYIQNKGNTSTHLVLVLPN